MTVKPLKVLIVEDEALLAMELESLIEDAGHEVVGWATNSDEARDMIDNTDADISFVDIHLNDGATGVDVAEYATDQSRSLVVFMTANPKKIPESFVGAVGVMAKPYSINGLMSALRFLQEGVRRPPPRSIPPAGLTLAPGFAAEWAHSPA